MDNVKLYVCWCKVESYSWWCLNSWVQGVSAVTRRMWGFCSLSWIIWFSFVGKKWLKMMTNVTSCGVLLGKKT